MSARLQTPATLECASIHLKEITLVYAPKDTEMMAQINRVASKTIQYTTQR